MQKKLTVLFVFAIFVLLIGWAITPVQAHCNGKPKHEASHGDDCTGGGSGGGGGGSLTANLTGGTFVLDNPLPVNLNKKGNILTSGQDLDMARPDAPSNEAVDWDNVFLECKATLKSLEIPTAIHIGDDDWRIAANSGDIRLRLFDARLDMNAVITLELRGVPDYSDDPIPPDDNGISQFTIDGYEIFGDTEKGVQPRESCRVLGPLLVPSELTICGRDVEVGDCHPVN